MVRKVCPYVLIFLGLFIFLFGEADAQGIISLPWTGQSKCYDSLGTVISCTGTGQDGDVQQTGVDWPNPRFTVSDECVIDNLTGLMWTKNANLLNTREAWDPALVYVASINSGSGLCGYKDWRLPNVNELESLVNAGEANTSTWLISQGFSNVKPDSDEQPAFYWSSTTNPNFSGYFYAWVVDVWNGYVYCTPWGLKSSPNGFVWPVRSTGINAPARLWKTGQVRSYDAIGGDDGALKKGVAWPSSRFTVNVNGAVTDNLTGLMWAENANLPNGTKTWQGALDYVKSMNSGAGLGGHHDWRLPNRKELFSLIDHSQVDYAVSVHQFQNLQTDYYWSSTTYAYDTSYAWLVTMRDGVVRYYDKSSEYYVWPVRLGQRSSGSPVISVIPNPFQFSNLIIGTTSDQTVIVKNYGNANLVIGSITVPSQPFSKTQDDCSGQTLAPNSTCTVTYRFVPTTSGEFFSNSSIPSNDPDENPVAVSLNGVGVAETISIPNILIGPIIGTTNTSYSYTTGGSTSNAGHTVEYQFDWKGDETDLSPWGSATQSKTWTLSGIYTIRVRARCATDISIESSWSMPGLPITIIVCTYSITPDNRTFNARGGAGSIDVNTQNGCGWAVVEDLSWLTITSETSGSGNGTVSYSISQNTGAARTGSFSIEDKIFSLTQAGVVDPSCGNWPVTRVTNNSFFYVHLSIQDALSAVEDGDTVKSQALDFIGDVIFDRNASVTLEGGYDCNYSANSQYSAIDGKLTIRTGTITIENIIIQ